MVNLAIASYLVGISVIFFPTQPKAIPIFRSKTGKSHDVKLAMDYLAKFGYLRKDNDFEIRSIQEFSEALDRFQNFAGINRTGVLDFTTLQKMNVPRCGVADVLSARRKIIHSLGGVDFVSNSTVENEFDYRATDQAHNIRRSKRYSSLGKWPNSKIAYRFGSYTDDLSIVQLREAIAQAFDVWSKDTSLAFEEVWLGEEDILISFLRGNHDDGYPFDGNGRTLAHAFFPGQGSRSGDVHFDEDETWTYTADETRGTNLFMVAAHEFGHALGLGHSYRVDSVMLPFYQGYREDFTLSEDDKIAIQQLYGQSERKMSANDGLSIDGSPLSGELQKKLCNYEFDAVGNIRNELFFIRDMYYWRFDVRGHSYREEKMSVFWSSFPDIRVDAVFTRPSDQSIVFISGTEYWVYIDNNKLDTGSPHPVSDFGLPMTGKIDTAFVWGANKRIYFFKGSKFYKYDELSRKIEFGYPKDISVLRGVPDNLDAAFNDPTDGNAYFLKGKKYWQFDDRLLSTSPGYPKYIGVRWFGCDPTQYFSTRSTVVEFGSTNDQVQNNSTNNKSSKIVCCRTPVLCLIFAALQIVFKRVL